MAIKKTSRPPRKKYENPTNFYEAVYRLMCRIPKGRVMTYGQIATILGAPRAARAVGYAMRACPEGLPWQRVINGKGQISARTDVERPMIQKILLEDEGIVFDDTDSCALETLLWEPRDLEKYYYEPSGKSPF